ncbi:MAG: bifunctional folylpolyglutamate synthase/dihydrofolate synthase [Alphaproteobacteria bacterium]|nr:bifunctional folylpolyglutamate synthase/dihydrofolate synthase [Alphaproteobacteria bacterium]MAS46985.1 bifunctional folylpolyglutamate synthase/dihydrofolate synthase [Alphaproteobacteria bacterium]MBN53465.1 bifunctional folylpolyglutamate synthase/dihydrofolate synthase [Alphaproteobacteria bacterium]OUT41466.1 MAG: hypothetical protein CBB62_03745 [Micavibrio sp. TMED2]|tara:strand:+ start:5662 stop:6981 length:1320 start_codon:yes stop_codon:yes gene_type:complete
MIAADSNHPVDVVLARLLRLHPKLIDLSLDRIERLLAALDNPHHHLPPVIHVAGTNGKGSTIAMITALAASQGLRVHRYTSPHLVRFNERIALSCGPGQLPQPIDDQSLLALLDRVEAANGGVPITFFEVTTAAAMLAFAEAPADLVVLETGLGGRVDATNVLAAPALSVITAIGLDHMGFLGDTVAAIAGEKAGIIKHGRPVVLAAQAHDAAVQVVEERARQLTAPILPLSEHPIGRLGLVGSHQPANARAALTAFEAFMAQRGEAIDWPTAEQALASVQWTARLQRLADTAFVAEFGQRREIWLDGAHNPEGMAALMHSWQQMHGTGAAGLVIGVMANKDFTTMAHYLADRFSHIVTVPVPGTEAGMPPADLAAVIDGCDDVTANVLVASDIVEAMGKLAETLPSDAPILIAGSLYLAGAVLRHLEGEAGRLALVGV